MKIGKRYILGTKAQLRGCINDVENLKDLLCNVYGWGKGSIKTLRDDGKGDGLPTKANIIENMQWLVKDAKAGDVLFFSFSGHGTQDMDLEGLEKDGCSETFLPCDFEKSGLLKDNTMAKILCVPLPEGVRLTVILDACHSGTGMDLSWEWDKTSNIWQEAMNPLHVAADVHLISG